MLELDGVCKNYDSGGGAVQALRATSFRIERGELCAIVGPSGSGKSSLMNLIGLLDAPSSGRLTLNGQDVTRLSPDAAADLRNRLLGFVFQSFELLPRLTALQNVALPLLYRGCARRDRDARALEGLTQVSLEHRAGFRPTQLSGGQRQRVAIARALVGDPALILADEPTGSLDSATSRDVMDLFLGLNRRLGVTILIITHDPDLARRCDRQIELLDGEVVHDSGRRVVQR
jgi:putative ABC transport system ATP-binding protein